MIAAMIASTYSESDAEPYERQIWSAGCAAWRDGESFSFVEKAVPILSYRKVSTVPADRWAYFATTVSSALAFGEPASEKGSRWEYTGAPIPFTIDDWTGQFCFP